MVGHYMTLYHFSRTIQKKLAKIVPATDWVCRYLLPLPHRWRSPGTSWRSRSTARWRPSWSPWPAVRCGYNCPAAGSWSSSTGHNPWRCCLFLLPQGKHVAMAMQNSKSIFCGFQKKMVPSGKQPHNYGKIHHVIAGKINYFDWAMASIAIWQSLPEGKPPFSYGLPMVFSWFSYGLLSSGLKKMVD